jgi:hypothetical protein
VSYLEQGSQSAVDWIVQFAKVLGSSIAEAADGTKKPVQYHVVGLPGWDLTGDEPVIDEDDTAAEVSSEAAVYGALGVTGRPLPPETSSEGRSEHAEVVCLRTADGLVPIAVRDIRLRMGGNAPNEGTVALVGYAGGYHSISPVDNTDLDKGSIHTIYAPYDFVSGVAQKAHVITLDPTSGNESISLVHGDGQAVFFQGDEIQIQTDGIPAGTGSTIQQSWVRLKPGEARITADAIVLNGTVYIGDNIGAVPLLPGPSSPACPRLMLNPAP